MLPKQPISSDSLYWIQAPNQWEQGVRAPNRGPATWKATMYQATNFIRCLYQISCPISQHN
uniref:Uncharacterized protein n=1 Tax=Arundo donax TaxID=35708 RepID=A0A0A9A205_ARUDO